MNGAYNSIKKSLFVNFIELISPARKTKLNGKWYRTKSGFSSWNDNIFEFIFENCLTAHAVMSEFYIQFHGILLRTKTIPMKVNLLCHMYDFIVTAAAPWLWLPLSLTYHNCNNDNNIHNIFFLFMHLSQPIYIVWTNEILIICKKWHGLNGIPS